MSENFTFLLASNSLKNCVPKFKKKSTLYGLKQTFEIKD